jgi:hypothetical protein
MSTFIPWPSITSFHNVRKDLSYAPEQFWENNTLFNKQSLVEYKAKIKLHGTNAAIQILNDGTILAQSRERLITPKEDNAGFASFAYSHDWSFAKNMIVFGEWCGKGIIKGCSVGNVPNKFFAVFAAQMLDDLTNLIVEPEQLQMFTQVNNTYVLPWHKSTSIDWRLTNAELQPKVDEINSWVAEVEANDPWVDSTFNIKGTGEGLVFYPTSPAHSGRERFKRLTFKAKGEKHKNISTAKPAQLDPEVVENIQQFTELTCTTARLEQMLSQITNPTIKMTGDFITSVFGDIVKEANDELEASNLSWKEVECPIKTKARLWYINKIKNN